VIDLHRLSGECSRAIIATISGPQTAPFYTSVRIAEPSDETALFGMDYLFVLSL
jgi:hypothetical protein